MRIATVSPAVSPFGHTNSMSGPTAVIERRSSVVEIFYHTTDGHGQRNEIDRNSKKDQCLQAQVQNEAINQFNNVQNSHIYRNNVCEDGHIHSYRSNEKHSESENVDPWGETLKNREHFVNLHNF